MIVLQEISGGPSRPHGQWNNHNLQQLRYLINWDLESIVWWYWLGDGNDDIPLLLV
jgi:hypothetical protein